jgi:beta-glucosidase
MGYEFFPEVLEASIRQAARVAGVPVILTENGVAGDEDSRRVESIQRAVKSLANCLKDGIDVRGYTYWSAFDNFEWMKGYKMKFGLVGVDRLTQARPVKPSARWLGSLAKSGILPE